MIGARCVSKGRGLRWWPARIRPMDACIIAPLGSICQLSLTELVHHHVQGHTVPARAGATGSGLGGASSNRARRPNRVDGKGKEAGAGAFALCGKEERRCRTDGSPRVRDFCITLPSGPWFCALCIRRGLRLVVRGLVSYGMRCFCGATLALQSSEWHAGTPLAPHL